MFTITDKSLVVPLLSSRVAAGFASPADDYLEGEIDLIGYLVRKPAATFVIQVTGHSMIGAGIMDKDYVIVDKSLIAREGYIVVAVLNGEMTIKRYSCTNGLHCLKSENPDFPAIPLYEDNPPEIWGVVVGCVRRYG